MTRAEEIGREIKYREERKGETERERGREGEERQRGGEIERVRERVMGEPVL